MYINKVITASWTDEEKETIVSFREFLQNKMDEIGDNLSFLHNSLNEIDTRLYDILYMDFEEDC